MNCVILMGNVGKDPEFKVVGQNGNPMAKFSLATTKTWKNKDGEKQEKTQWHNITVWGKRAETIQKYVKKGSKLLVRGEIEYREYEKDGQKKYFTEILAEDFDFAGGGASKDSTITGGGAKQAAPEQDELQTPIPF